MFVYQLIQVLINDRQTLILPINPESSAKIIKNWSFRINVLLKAGPCCRTRLTNQYSAQKSSPLLTANGNASEIVAPGYRVVQCADPCLAGVSGRERQKRTVPARKSLQLLAGAGRSLILHFLRHPSFSRKSLDNENWLELRYP